MLLCAAVAFGAAAYEGNAPAVTHITAEWNGVVLLSVVFLREGPVLLPAFSSENLTVTAHYSDGQTREIGFTYRWFDESTGIATIRSRVDDQWHNATFDFPKNFVQLYIESLALVPQSSPALNVPRGCSVVAFVPQASGRHAFVFSGGAMRTFDFLVLDENFQQVPLRSFLGAHPTAELQQGSTYYVLSSNSWSEFQTMEVRHLNFLQRAWHWVTVGLGFGLFGLGWVFQIIFFIFMAPVYFILSLIFGPLPPF